MKSVTSHRSSDSPTSPPPWRTAFTEPNSPASPNKDKLSREAYSNLRVVQRNLVYVISLSPELADEAKLSRYEYFGQYGSIKKCVVNTANAYSHPDFYTWFS
mmetsp:Transcript_6621/g.11652  ORF Transcript_6621/g.11652 Transcript_6621/m.11652 type:complete len:102 (-) Transcript_6621:2741-3046(-)